VSINIELNSLGSASCVRKYRSMAIVV